MSLNIIIITNERLMQPNVTSSVANTRQPFLQGNSISIAFTRITSKVVYSNSSS